MGKGRATQDGLTRIAWFVAPLLTALAAPSSGQEVRLTEAAERGTFNVGAARAGVKPSTDPAAGAILRFDYTIPPGAAAGVWAKRFPEGLKEGASTSSARPPAPPTPGGSARSPSPWRSRARPASSASRWSSTPTGPRRAGRGLEGDRHAVGGRRLGQPRGEGAASGTIDLDVRFERCRSRGGSPRTGPRGSAACSWSAWSRPCWRAWRRGDRRPSAPGGLLRDASRGGGGGDRGPGDRHLCPRLRGPMEVGWLPLGFAVVGVALGEWWKYGLTGRHLTPVEALRDGLATGLLAASSSPLAILQAPREWSDLLALSGVVAAVAAARYHAAHAAKVASSGRHLGGIAGALIVGTPYAVGGLVLLESAELMRTLGNDLAARALSSRPEAAGFLGRVAVLFAFNELAANALGLATKETPLRSAKAHLALLAVAVAAIAGPWIAAQGSGGGRLVAAGAACWPSWRPRSCRRRGSGPKGIS
ncbi:MAG: hypothetical protein WKF75_20660 [Singulisphaera sp.]